MILSGGKMKELNKENLENMSYKDIAYILLEKSDSLNTLDLFTKIVELLELSKSTIDSKIADFYTSLTTDKRFVMLDGKWDLRTRHPSDKVIVKIDDEEDEDVSLVGEEDEDVDTEFEEDEYGDGDTSEDEFDDNDDDLKDLVVLDESELEEE